MSENRFMEADLPVSEARVLANNGPLSVWLASPSELRHLWLIMTVLLNSGEGLQRCEQTE